MLSVEECKKLLSKKDLSEKRIEEIRDYLYAIVKSIVSNEIETYERVTRQEKNH